MDITIEFIKGLCLGIEYFDGATAEEREEMEEAGLSEDEIEELDLGFAVIISLLFVRIVLASKSDDDEVE